MQSQQPRSLKGAERRARVNIDLLLTVKWPPGSTYVPLSNPAGFIFSAFLGALAFPS